MIGHLIDVCKSVFKVEPPYHVIGPDEGSSLFEHVPEGNNMIKTRGDYKRKNKRVARDIASVSADNISHRQGSAIIVDDIVSTGSTMISAITELEQANGLKAYCVCAHGLFLGDSESSISKIASGIISSDTVKGKHSTPLVAQIFEEVVHEWGASSAG